MVLALTDKNSLSMVGSMVAEMQQPPRSTTTPLRPHLGTFRKLHHMTRSRVLKAMAKEGDFQTEQKSIERTIEGYGL